MSKVRMYLTEQERDYIVRLREHHIAGLRRCGSCGGQGTCQMFQFPKCLGSHYAVCYNCGKITDIYEVDGIEYSNIDPMLRLNAVIADVLTDFYGESRDDKGEVQP